MARVRNAGVRAAALGALLAALLAADAAAGRVRFETPGGYRLRVIGIGAFPLDELGTDTGQRQYGLHRLRIDPTLEAGPLTVRLQADVLTGQIFGDTNPIGARFVDRRASDPDDRYAGWTTVEPRMLWAELRTPWAVVRLGQMGSHWGMGLLANDGTDPGRPPLEGPHWVERFGDRWNGDLVDRILVATTPLAPFTHGDLGDLVLAVGADFVYQDDQASFLDGDEAWQIVGSILYPGEEVWLGSYVARREQIDRDGERLSVTAFDVYGRWLAPLYRLGADLRLQAEAVLVLGETDRLRPVSSPDGVAVRQLGWAARAEVAWRCPRVALGVEVGYASGDEDADDDEIRVFTFDPDYRVGFILFPDLLRILTLRSAERLSDPRRVGEPPPGTEHLPTDGSVRNVAYIFPGLTWRPGAWRLTGALLLAWAAEPFAEPFATFAAGGEPRNPRGAPASRFYGHEIDGALHRAFVLPGLGTVEMGAQAGVFVPGGALDGPGGTDPVWKVAGRLDLRW